MIILIVIMFLLVILSVFALFKCASDADRRIDDDSNEE